MTTIEVAHNASLIVSIMAALACIVLFYCRKRARPFYLAMFVGWVFGIIYYSVGTFDAATFHLAQYLLFSGWFIQDALERVITSPNIKRWVKSILVRMAAWERHLP